MRNKISVGLSLLPDSPSFAILVLITCLPLCLNLIFGDSSLDDLKDLLSEGSYSLSCSRVYLNTWISDRSDWEEGSLGWILGGIGWTNFLAFSFEYRLARTWGAGSIGFSRTEDLCVDSLDF